jgi:hypothetical protein
VIWCEMTFLLGVGGLGLIIGDALGRLDHHR